jgi:hypothetical protein
MCHLLPVQSNPRAILRALCTSLIKLSFFVKSPIVGIATASQTRRFDQRASKATTTWYGCDDAAGIGIGERNDDCWVGDNHDPMPTLKRQNR